MGKSKHSKTGKLNSKAGWYGLAKKGSILMLIIVAVRLDILLNTNYVRDAVCIAFCVNELLSIVENTSLMGIPYPPALKNAIEVLQKQAGRKEKDDDFAARRARRRPLSFDHSALAGSLDAAAEAQL